MNMKETVSGSAVSARVFTEKEWNTVLSHLAAAIGAEAETLRSRPAARLFAAIPYLSGSEDPDRFAVSNLLTFWGATKARGLFSHRESDNADLYRRLATFHVGSQADKDVVEYGKKLLAFTMLNDHEHDAEADRAIGKFNPINSGAWVAGAMKAELRKELDKAPEISAAFEQVIGPDEKILYFW